MPILLVADTPAKYSVLNWISHIGYYGCCYCFNKGERFVRRHYYPLHPYNMRTLESYKLDLSTLARNPGLKSSRGVKGPSALSNFLPNLPLSASIDYMHQIALEVGRTVLENIQKEISNSALMEIKKKYCADNESKFLSIYPIFHIFVLGFSNRFSFFSVFRCLLRSEVPLDACPIFCTSKRPNVKTGFYI